MTNSVNEESRSEFKVKSIFIGSSKDECKLYLEIPKELYKKQFSIINTGCLLDNIWLMKSVEIIIKKLFINCLSDQIEILFDSLKENIEGKMLDKGLLKDISMKLVQEMIKESLENHGLISTDPIIKHCEPSEKFSK